MKKFLSLAFICFICFSVSTSAQQNKNVKLLRNKSKAALIDRLIRSYADIKLFNGSVLIAQRGRVILKMGYGSANMEWGVANTSETKFRIGSVTKQFTAMLIMQLKESGKIKLEDKITNYLPWYRKDTGNKITIRHLLTHTSGLPNYTENAAAIDDINTHDYSPKEIAAKYCAGDSEFEPGTKFKYSNSGYFLLGVIIEAVTGETYAEVLREKIFQPLGMKNSGIETPTELIANRAAGYEYGFEGYVNANYINMASATYAAGAVYSTVEDLYRWQNALFGDRLLSKENKALMFAPNLNRYAYGLYINKYKPQGMKKEITAVGHPGGINGFSALLMQFIEDEITVIFLDNTRVGKRGNLENISAGILFILNGLSPEQPRQSIQTAMSEKIKTSSGEQLASFYRRAKSQPTAVYDFANSEVFLNNLGYFLLGKGRLKDSLAVLKLAVEEFPQSANTFDTYAEALMKDGQKKLAAENYRRAIELNPQNTNAIEQLRRLESQP